MKKWWKIATPFVTLAFVAGVGFGVWSKRQHAFKMSSTQPLKVLCAEDWLSETILNEFSAANKIPIQLITYAKPDEFLYQMANSGGEIDVICTSSFLLKGLLQSHWLQKIDWSELFNSGALSVDFMHLPFDPQSEYSVPLFWNLYGVLGKTSKASKMQANTLKQVWSQQRLAVWGSEMSLLTLMNRLGVKVEDRLSEQPSRTFETDLQNFLSRATDILKPGSNTNILEDVAQRADGILLPLGRAATMLTTGGDYQFFLPSDGGTVEVGILTIGAKANNPKMAHQLIDALLTGEVALDLHQRLQVSVVHASLDSSTEVPDLQKASALRKFPLNRLKFVDIDLEALPGFQKIFSSRRQ